MQAKIIVAVIIFSLVLMMHLIRLIFKLPATFGNFKVPLFFSVIAIIFLTILIYWLIR